MRPSAGELLERKNKPPVTHAESSRGGDTTELDAHQVYQAASVHPPSKPSAQPVLSQNPPSGSVFSSQSHIAPGVPSEVPDEPDRAPGINLLIFSLPPFELTAIFVLSSIAPAVRNNSQDPMSKARKRHPPDEQGQTRATTEPKGLLASSGMTAAMAPPPPNNHSPSPPLEKGIPDVRIPSIQPGTQTPLDGPGPSMPSSPAREGNVNSARADQVARTVSVQPLPESRLYPPRLPGTSMSSSPGERNVNRTRADQLERIISTQLTGELPLVSGPREGRPGVSTSTPPSGERNANRTRAGQVKPTTSAQSITKPPLVSGPPEDRPGISESTSTPPFGERNVNRTRADQVKPTTSAQPITKPPLVSGPPEDRPGISTSTPLFGERSVNRTRADQVKLTTSAQPITKPPLAQRPPEDRSGVSISVPPPGEIIVKRTRANQVEHTVPDELDKASGNTYLIFYLPLFKLTVIFVLPSIVPPVRNN
jgi:hypothetical protein